MYIVSAKRHPPRTLLRPIRLGPFTLPPDMPIKLSDAEMGRWKSVMDLYRPLLDIVCMPDVQTPSPSVEAEMPVTVIPTKVGPQPEEFPEARPVVPPSRDTSEKAAEKQPVDMAELLLKTKVELRGMCDVAGVAYKPGDSRTALASKLAGE